MLFFTSPLDQTADRLVSARYKVAQAERQGCGVEEARLELKIAEAAWQAVCDGAKSYARAKGKRRTYQPKTYQPRWTKRTLSALLSIDPRGGY